MPTLPFDIEIGTRRDDVLAGTARTDFIFGRDGDDVIRLGGGDDVASGGAGADSISGGSGDDLIDGGGGADRLAGGTGDDVMRGGGGRDVYLFDPSREDEGRDMILGFRLGVDKISLDAGAVLDATPGLAEAIVAGGGDVAAVLAGLDASADWGLRGNHRGDLVIDHPNGSIVLRGVPADGVESFADIGGALSIEGLGEALTGLAGETGVPASIAAVLAESGDGFDDDASDFDMLLAAAGAAGLVEALADEDASLTAFAPTDAAFVSLAERLGFEGAGEAEAFDFIVGALTDLGGGDPIPLLTDVLSYHVADGSATLGELQAERRIDTLLGGAQLRIAGDRLVDAEPDLDDAQVIAADIQTGNGVIHAIDQVLLPLDL